MSFYISHRGIYGNSYEMLDALFWIDDRLSAEAVVELLHFLKRHYRNSPEEVKKDNEKILEHRKRVERFESVLSEAHNN